MIHRPWLAAFLLAAGAHLLAACGGGDDYWDEYQPRAAQVRDIENQSFVFRDFNYGGVFDASLGATTTTLSFGFAQASGPDTLLPFTLAAKSVAALGTATFTGPALSLRFGQVDAALPFSTTQTLAFDISADLDDGRIQLRNQATGLSQTSAPR